MMPDNSIKLLLLISLQLLLFFQVAAQKQAPQDVFRLHVKIYNSESTVSTHIDYKVNDFRLHYDHQIEVEIGTGDFDENEHKKFAHREQRALFQFLEKTKELIPEKSIDWAKTVTNIEMTIELDYLKDGKIRHWQAVGEKSKIEKTAAFQEIVALEALIAMMCDIPNILSEQN